MFFGGDPFEHFAGMHGGGGGGGGGGSRRSGMAARDVDTTKLYETLGVSSYYYLSCCCFMLTFLRYPWEWGTSKQIHLKK
jgi:hypothetical protein